MYDGRRWGRLAKLRTGSTVAKNRFRTVRIATIVAGGSLGQRDSHLYGQMDRPLKAGCNLFLLEYGRR